ncbi:CIC11C00000005393 [Sungouiella intermedia]|uniref:Protein EFR3 n=1 Tax=Sungouiella intermedia TaxID=45354 RepID=A0A1L0BFV3_9ASCO|nr:CIC11C00000005393 [[Candida] intermedia]
MFSHMKLVPKSYHVSPKLSTYLNCSIPRRGQKPNPLELSYLLYYASTRRVKLEKVIDYLDHKTKSDSRGNKSGNLQVTLSIVSALIEKCADNLNVFAFQVCSILTSVLNTGELPLCKSLVATYGVLCSKLDGGLFTGDKDFVESFSRLTDGLLDVGVTKLKIPGPNQREWLLLSLLTSRYVFNCLGFNAAVSHRFIGKCVPLLTATVRDYSSYDTLLNRLNSNLNVEKDDRRVSRVATAAAHSVAHGDVDDESLTEDELKEEALNGLKALFNTSLSSQISEATIEVVNNNLRDGNVEESPWGVTFLEMCASWIPVQLRFVALSTLLYKLSVVSEQLPSQKATYPHVVHYAQSILGLVSSNFNMIGLSITDVLQQLLSLQTNLYIGLAHVLSVDQTRNLSEILSQCICNLSSHIYYFDQVLDSIVAILLQIDSVMISASKSNVTITHDLVITFLDTISTILNLLSRKLSTIARNHATLENWELSFLLLTFTKSFREFAIDATPEQISNIQTKYLTVLNEFLTTELIKGDERSEEDVNVPASSTNYGKFLTPNYNDYIENSENALSHLLVHCNAFFGEQSVNLYVARMLLDTLKNLLGITGINFIHNFLPVFPHWQILEVTKQLPDCAKDTTAYLLLNESLKVLNEKYRDSIHFDVSQLSLAKNVAQDIAVRRELAVWVNELDGTNGEGSLAMGEPIPNEVNKKAFYEFFSQTSLPKFGSRNLHPDFRNGESLLNGNISELLQSASSHSNEEAYEGFKTPPRSNLVNGYGLGTANDISSIHSGLFNSNFKSNGYHSPDATQMTSDTLPTIGTHYLHEANNYKHSLMPRVSDLKQSVLGTKLPNDHFSFTNDRPASIPRSVLQKQIHTTDVTSILNGLHSEDDEEIIV